MVFNLGSPTPGPQWNTYKEYGGTLTSLPPPGTPGRSRIYDQRIRRGPRAGHRKAVIMGFFGFLLLGLLAGAVAKLILPGKQGGGWLVTLLLGVVGALLGGWLAGLIFGVNMGSFFDLRTWVIAILGSIIVLLIYGAATRNRSGST